MSEVYNSIPSAHLLLSSLRSVGYTAETAIADIIDNSITAKATEVNIVFDWQCQLVIVYDNGTGMSKDELLASMAIGSSDPEKERDYFDLGRFGMGMKTAAFSLGKCLTVVSKLNNEIVNASWNLDYIKENNDWSLLVSDNSDVLINKLSDFIADYNNGTLICISQIDKLISPGNSIDKEKKKFYKTIDNIKHHLSMVFHRFIEKKEVVLKVNNTPLATWNPFCPNNRAVQELECEEIIHEGHKILIQPYILPHKTKFHTEDDFKKAGGHKGWLQHQGFYVYRNNRLIVFGTWFGIVKKEMSYNLARISLEINSDSDFDWQIDIKKSKAVPPIYIEEAIKRAAEISVKQSVKVYNSRGTYTQKADINAPQLGYVWEQRKDSKGRYSFYLNKKHTLLNKLKISMTKEQKETLSAYLELIEKCSPMALSGITETINDTSDVISDAEFQSIIYNAKELISALHKNGYEKEEIRNLFQQLSDYCCIMDKFDKLYSEVT